METNKAATAMQDSDGASDCSNFSIITPPSASSKSSCGKCCSQDKTPEKVSDVAPVANEQDRTKTKKRRPIKSQRLQAEVSQPCIHSLTEKSENLSTRMTDVELRMWNFQFEAAAKSANENNSGARDTIQAEIGLEKETMATLLKNQNQHLWEEVACILRQALLEHEFISPPGTRQYLPLQDQNWCFEIVKNAFIASLVDDAKRDAATSMLATSTLASDGLPKKKKKAMGRSDWTEPNVVHDPFLPQPQPEVYGMTPMGQYPGHPDPFAPRQPMPYPPPPNPDAYGMPPTTQYPDRADPFAHMRPAPYSPPPPMTPPPMPIPEVHVMGDFPRPPKPFAGPQSQPYSPPYSPTPSPRRAIESGASSFVDWREKPRLKSKSRSRLRINKFEVRWWMRTALSAFEILCMIAVIIAVFRAPGLLGELVDVMHPKNKDRCLGFRVRR
ncbi:hypothetical protein Q7P36_002437 [Cladosporium allicinum]